MMHWSKCGCRKHLPKDLFRSAKFGKSIFKTKTDRVRFHATSAGSDSPIIFPIKCKLISCVQLQVGRLPACYFLCSRPQKSVGPVSRIHSIQLIRYTYYSWDTIDSILEGISVYFAGNVLKAAHFISESA